LVDVNVDLMSKKSVTVNPKQYAYKAPDHNR